MTLWAVSSGKWSLCLSLIRATRKSRNPSARIWSVSDVRWKRSSAQLRVVSYNHLTQFKTLKNLKKKIVFPVKCHYYFKSLEESFLQQNKLEFGMINWRLRIFATKQTCSQVRRGNRGNSVRDMAPHKNRVFSLTWPASMQIYWNKRKRLRKKRVQLPEDWFGTPTWPPFHCFGTPIWPPWRHVKTLYTQNVHD